MYGQEIAVRPLGVDPQANRPATGVEPERHPRALPDGLLATPSEPLDDLIEPKRVLVMRRDLGMRRDKEIAQGRARQPDHRSAGVTGSSGDAVLVLTQRGHTPDRTVSGMNPLTYKTVGRNREQPGPRYDIFVL